MDVDLKEQENKIKKKWRFGWTLRYKEEFETNLDARVFLYLSNQAIEKLDWVVVYADENSIEAKRMDRWHTVTEKITVTYGTRGKVTVTSQSMNGHFLDFGFNSKRARMFILVVQHLISSCDKEKIKELEKEIDDQENWNDYIVPETLPPPPVFKEPQYKYFVIGYLLTAILSGYILALLSLHLIYVIVLFELGVALLFGLATKYILKLSNFTDYNRIRFTLIISIILTFFSCEFFIYINILGDINGISFWEYLTYKLRHGLQFDNKNLGSIGQIIAWIIQTGLTYWLANIFIIHRISSYISRRVPVEVIDYVFYLLVKDKSQQEIDNALDEKGWIDSRNRDEVYYTIEYMRVNQELMRE